MKKTKIKFLFLAMLIGSMTILTASCEKDDIVTNSSVLKPNQFKYDSSGLKPNQFEYVGLEHNKGLDYVYNGLKKELNTIDVDKLNRDELFEIVNKYSNEFYAKSEITKNYLSESIELSEKHLNSISLYYKYHSPQENGEDSYIDSCITNGRFTDIQKSLLFELINRVNSANELSEIQLIIKEINDKAIRLITDSSELAIIFIATNVMEYSCSYWAEHFDEWNNLFNNNKAAPSDKWWSWQTVGKADAVGAASGATTGAMLGVVAGGIGALPGAVLGGTVGGIGSSVGDAASQLWDHWFKN